MDDDDEDEPAAEAKDNEEEGKVEEVRACFGSFVCTALLPLHPETSPFCV